MLPFGGRVTARLRVRNDIIRDMVRVFFEIPWSVDEGERQTKERKDCREAGGRECWGRMSYNINFSDSGLQQI